METNGMRIVGVGASAGGLLALQQFLKNVPAESGLALVIVQHLAPSDRGLMVELLQHASASPVVQVTDHIPLEPNRVYVIPPSQDLALRQGSLYLLEPAVPHGQRRAIDFFFDSLAEEMRERSVGVVLSGMGDDGTQGLRSIRRRGGLTFVQEPGTAKFDDMPRSAIAAGVAEVVASAEALPALILEARPRLSFEVRSRELRAAPPGGLPDIVGVLRAATGHDFSLYKNTTLQRRIQRRMDVHKLQDTGHYLEYLRANPQEGELLFKEILIGVTRFFRDPAAWESLQQEALPGMLDALPAGAPLRAWVPGCSTGEEAYSLAIAIREALEQRPTAPLPVVRIFATDLDGDAIAKARRGLYRGAIEADLSPERLRRFFVREGSGYRVHRDIRDWVIFAPHNVIQDPPFTKLDLLSCRNLLIYLSTDLQRKLMPLFHHSLRPGGVLFLGGAETTGSAAPLFTTLNSAARLYRRLEAPLHAPPVDFPVGPPNAVCRVSEAGRAPLAAGRLSPTIRPNLQALAEQFLVQRMGPTALIASHAGDILYFSGRPGKYLELPAGKMNWNVFAMARGGLQSALTEAFERALRERTAVTITGIELSTDSENLVVDLAVEPIAEPVALGGSMMIIFADRATPPALEVPLKSKRPETTRAARARLEHELSQAQTELGLARQWMQRSQEELKATNEELQCTNEELQSSNEELTTSKEEMQSLNEELQTLNQELQSKVDDLSRTGNDMKNLLDSTEIAVLFLDEALAVRRFTPQMTSLIKLIASDVGRPLEDLASTLDYPGIFDDAREVSRTLVFREKAVPSKDGRWFSVRVMPYRTLDNRIDGLVITFTNITLLKTLERSLQTSPT